MFTQVVFVLWQVLVSELIKYEMLTKTEEIRMGANTFALHYMIISLYHLLLFFHCNLVFYVFLFCLILGGAQHSTEIITGETSTQ